MVNLAGVIEWLAQLEAPALFAAIALLAFCETAVFADLLVPGEVGMLVVAAAGAEAGLSWPALAACAAVGATAGDAVSYAVGRAWGSRILDRRRRKGGRSAAAVDRATDVFSRMGGPAVFLGRWIGVLRALVPMVAGSAGMPLRRFLAWNVLASVSWAGAVVAVGYHLGPAASRFLRGAGWAAVAVLVAWTAVWLVRRRLRGAGTESRREGNKPLHAVEQEHGVAVVGIDEETRAAGNRSRTR